MKSLPEQTAEKPCTNGAFLIALPSIINGLNPSLSQTKTGFRKIKACLHIKIKKPKFTDQTAKLSPQPQLLLAFGLLK